MLHLMFKLLRFCYLRQKSLVETIFYFDIVKPNVTLRKLKQGKKNQIRKELWVEKQS